MWVTDYSITWTSPYRATIAWTGGSSNAWFTIFINGISASTVYGSGEMAVQLSLNEKELHSIFIVQHWDKADQTESPESTCSLQPTLKWLPVENAAQYLIYMVADEDDYEYLLTTLPDIGEDIYSWQFSSALFLEGLNVVRMKVYAMGSWGLCETPSFVSGIAIGHPPRAATISVEGMELTLAVS